MEQYISLLIQLPVVGIFAWFVLQIRKQETETNGRVVKALDELAKQVAVNTSIMLMHDAAVRGGNKPDCMEIAQKLMGEKK